MRTDLSYDPVTGILSSNVTGNPVGTFDESNQYLRVHYNGRSEYVHRLAWFLYYGAWPEYIDHINGDRTDNRIVNLRSVSAQENAKNNRLRSNNKSGLIGVSWVNNRYCWRAYITVHGKQHHLGYFYNKYEAAIVRRMAEYHFEFGDNHGSTQTRG